MTDKRALDRAQILIRDVMPTYTIPQGKITYHNNSISATKVAWSDREVNGIHYPHPSMIPEKIATEIYDEGYEDGYADALAELEMLCRSE